MKPQAQFRSPSGNKNYRINFELYRSSLQFSNEEILLEESKFLPYIDNFFYVQKWQWLIYFMWDFGCGDIFPLLVELWDGIVF